jgi:SulP family sulfate permease
VLGALDPRFRGGDGRRGDRSHLFGAYHSSLVTDTGELAELLVLLVLVVGIIFLLCGLVRLGAANWVTFAIGATALALLYIFETRAPRAPAPLMIMAAGILVVSVLRLAHEHGVHVVGVIHPGLPAVNLPKANFDDVLELLPGAFAIALFILSEALGVVYSLGSKYGYDIDANQELIALGVSNLAAACLGGLASGCSVSSTAVNDRAGAKSEASSLPVC